MMQPYWDAQNNGGTLLQINSASSRGEVSTRILGRPHGALSHNSLFLTAPRVVLTQDPSTETDDSDVVWLQATRSLRLRSGCGVWLQACKQTRAIAQQLQLEFELLPDLQGTSCPDGVLDELTVEKIQNAAGIWFGGGLPGTSQHPSSTRILG